MGSAEERGEAATHLMRLVSEEEARKVPKLHEEMAVHHGDLAARDLACEGNEELRKRGLHGEADEERRPRLQANLREHDPLEELQRAHHREEEGERGHAHLTRW